MRSVVQVELDEAFPWRVDTGGHLEVIASSWWRKRAFEQTELPYAAILGREQEDTGGEGVDQRRLEVERRKHERKDDDLDDGNIEPHTRLLLQEA